MANVARGAILPRFRRAPPAAPFLCYATKKWGKENALGAAAPRPRGAARRYGFWRTPNLAVSAVPFLCVRPVARLPPPRRDCWAAKFAASCVVPGASNAARGRCTPLLPPDPGKTHRLPDLSRDKEMGERKRARSGASPPSKTSPRYTGIWSCGSFGAVRSHVCLCVNDSPAHWNWSTLP